MSVREPRAAKRLVVKRLKSAKRRAHARMFAARRQHCRGPGNGQRRRRLGSYLVYHGASGAEAVDGRVRFIIEQGDFMHRPSRIKLDVKGKPGTIEEVRVGGPSVASGARGSHVLISFKFQVSSFKFIGKVSKLKP